MGKLTKRIKTRHFLDTTHDSKSKSMCTCTSNIIKPRPTSYLAKLTLTFVVLRTTYNGMNLYWRFSFRGIALGHRHHSLLNTDPRYKEICV